MANYNSPAAAHKPAHGGYLGQVQEPKTEGPLTQEFGADKVSALLSALVSVRAGVEDCAAPDVALCSILEDTLEAHGENPYAFVDIRNYLYKKWPDFSGNATYPVPGRGTDEDDGTVSDHWMCRYSDGEELDFDDPATVADAYYNAVDDGILHDYDFWAGAYGEKRKQLLQFMIDELTKEAAQ